MFLRLLQRARHRGVTSRMLSLGNYLTDGQRLLRVASRLDAGRGHTLIALEDCVTLELRPCTRSELAAMELRAVLTADAVELAAGKIAQLHQTDCALAMLDAEAC